MCLRGWDIGIGLRRTGGGKLILASHVWVVADRLTDRAQGWSPAPPQGSSGPKRTIARAPTGSDTVIPPIFWELYQCERAVCREGNRGHWCYHCLWIQMLSPGGRPGRELIKPSQASEEKSDDLLRVSPITMGFLTDGLGKSELTIAKVITYQLLGLQYHVQCLECYL